MPGVVASCNPATLEVEFQNDVIIIIIIIIIIYWQDVKILQLKYLHNRSYTKNSTLIKVNKLKLIWNNVKEPGVGSIPVGVTVLQ